MNASLPSSILPHVLWSCSSKIYETPEAFDQAVRQYQIDITGEDSWRPNDVVFPGPRMDVQFRCWQDKEDIEPRLRLDSSHPEHFTALDLLYQMHNGVARYLVEHNAVLSDHHFFEGLQGGARGAGQSPLYFIRFGS